MNEFLSKIAAILEVDCVNETDDLKAFSQWDSLSALSVIAMVDASYGMTLQAADLQAVGTVGNFGSVCNRKSLTIQTWLLANNYASPTRNRRFWSAASSGAHG